MVVGIQAVRVPKVCVPQANFPGSSIHHLDETLDRFTRRFVTLAPADGAGNGHGGVVAGRDHQTIEEVTQRYLIIEHQTHRRFADEVMVNDPRSGVQIGMPHDDNRRHQLGQRCQRYPLTRVTLIEHLVEVRQHNQILGVSQRRIRLCPCRQRGERNPGQHECDDENTPEGHCGLHLVYP